MSIESFGILYYLETERPLRFLFHFIIHSSCTSHRHCYYHNTRLTTLEILIIKN